MARIRTIKPEFWKNEGLCALPEATHMLAAALLNYSDDFGYFNANPKLIEGEIYPLRKPSVKIPESLQSLVDLAYIELGTGPDGRRYGRVRGFVDHQKVSHPAKSKIADIPISWDASRNPPEPSGESQEKIQNVPDTLRPEQGTGNRERNREAPRASRFGEFWDLCPRKVGKGKAKSLFDRIVRDVGPELLLSAMRKHAASQVGKDPAYIPHPATWLSQRRWEDEDSGPGAANVLKFQPTADEQRAETEALEKLRLKGAIP